MPPTYCPCPRPILKRRSPSPTQDPFPPPVSPRDESAALLNIDPSVLHPLVHFAPPSALARTYAADSPAIYDRSPIVVAPNRCSLPARGCPGRTYLPGDADGDEPERLAAAAAFAAARQRGGRRHRDASPAGRHLHSRAARAHAPHNDDDEHAQAPAVADPHPMPPLIPDGSSSSDSEESDGFVSPPLENTALASAPLYTTSLPFASPTPARAPGLSIPMPPDVSAAFSSMYLCPKPKPMPLAMPMAMPAPPSPLAFRSRLATYSPRSSSPARPLSPTQPRAHSPCRDASPTARRRRSHSKTKRVRGCPGEVDAGYRAFQEQGVADEGCLGGF